MASDQYVNVPAARPPLSQALAIALLAAAGLAYEIALTRLLSALLVSNWVAPVLAVALLGLGLGAALAALFDELRTSAAARTAAALGAVVGVLSLPAWLWSVAQGRPLFGLILPLATYVAVGISASAILSWWPRRAAWLLRADYLAAAFAALATPWLLGQFGLGAPGGLVLAAALAGLAALFIGGSRAGLPSAAATAGIAAPLLALLALAVGALAVDPVLHMRAKPLAAALRNGAVVETTRWDATARTDLLRAPNGARYLYMDGGAGSLVATPDPRNWSADVGAFAFAMAPAESAFLIGSGGGLDVAQARAAGVERVVAVEVNEASVDLVRGLGESTGLVYQEPTEVVIGDGRRVLAGRVLAGSAERFDVITLANVVTGAAELRGAALTENSVYTVEAFKEYLGHLSPDGRLALKLYDEITLTRALTTALAALVESGLAPSATDAMGHLLAVLDVSAGSAVPLLVVKRSAFSPAEAVAAARVAEQRGWSLLLVPGLLAPGPLQALAEGDSGLTALIASSPQVDLTPTRDASPYFFSFEPGVPGTVRLAGLASVLVIAALLLAALVAGNVLGAQAGAGRTRPAAALVGPGTAVTARRLAGAAATVRALISAVALGAGLLLVELVALPLIQRSAGHPAWSLSLTLGAVLLGSAIGAQLATRRRSSAMRVSALVAAVAVLAWCTLAPGLAAALDGLPPALSGAVMGATLLLASIPLGVPFPLLLALLGRATAVAAALALSGTAAVAAGTAALWLSHAVGIAAIGWAAGLAYLLVALLAPTEELPSTGPEEVVTDADPVVAGSPPATFGGSDATNDAEIVEE